MIEVAGENDSIIDVDVEEVCGHFQIRHRLPHQASAVIAGRLRLERFRTEGYRDRASDRVSPDLKWNDLSRDRIG